MVLSTYLIVGSQEMDAGFVDLDILLTRIRHPQSKVYFFLDAFKAYKAGALRGALTSAWVALAYDLIAKYRELSALGDTAAAAFLQAWDNATNSGDMQAAPAGTNNPGTRYRYHSGAESNRSQTSGTPSR